MPSRRKLQLRSTQIKKRPEKETEAGDAPSYIGRYEIIDRIAAGGMATVYVCRVQGVGGFARRMAIKVMHEHVASEPQVREMFLDEARLAARIHHPNVVSTMDVGILGERVFMVMEYVEGPNLSRLCKQVELDLPTSLRIMSDALAGIHAAHEVRDDEGHLLHLVHRDISPQNILIGMDGISRITDFGIARARSRLASTPGQTIKGKLRFMAPEQALCLKLDRRTDVYAAGVVLWELMTGQRMISGANMAHTLRAVLKGPPAAPSALNPAVPEPLSRVCMRALAKEPNDRPVTAAAFLLELEDAMTEAGVSAATPRAVAALVEALAR